MRNLRGRNVCPNVTVVDVSVTDTKDVFLGIRLWKSFENLSIELHNNHRFTAIIQVNLR